MPYQISYSTPELAAAALKEIQARVKIMLVAFETEEYPAQLMIDVSRNPYSFRRVLVGGFGPTPRSVEIRVYPLLPGPECRQCAEDVCMMIGRFGYHRRRVMDPLATAEQPAKPKKAAAKASPGPAADKSVATRLGEVADQVHGKQPRKRKTSA